MCLGLGVSSGCRGSGYARATRGPNGRLVGGAQDYFCKSWDCVTSDDGPWRWEVGNRDLLNFSFAKPTPRALGDPTFECEESCNYAQVKVRFNRKKAKKERAWISGLSWEIQTRMVAGTQIYGEIIIISQILEPMQIHSIGPNPMEKIDVTPYPTTSLPISQRPTRDPEAGSPRCWGPC